MKIVAQLMGVKEKNSNVFLSIAILGLTYLHLGIFKGGGAYGTLNEKIDPRYF